MKIEDVISARKIQRTLHFTTNRGVLGVLATGLLKSRKRLNADDQLKHIFQPNAASRDKDIAWLDYVNLSVSEINGSFFDICARKWHRGKEFWWAILEFEAQILSHDGVFFSTTNNIYTSVERGIGGNGLEALFAPSVRRWPGSVAYRPNGLSQDLPTCCQAEILYPGELSTRFLSTIHIDNYDIEDEVAAQIAAVGHDSVNLKISPEMFRKAP
jgi:hypothetical protein